MQSLVLSGCRLHPLASYLKALGVLRIIATHREADPAVRGFWQHDRFVLQTPRSADALVRFFLQSYRPTPILSPWNGGSGFYPKDNQDALQALEESTDPRFDAYRRTIAAARSILAARTLKEKPDKELKAGVLAACRAEFPEEALPWLSCTYAMTSQGRIEYAPILGSGGNDGRLEFGRNFLERLVESLGLHVGEKAPRHSEERLRQALFASVRAPGVSATPGQFFPGAVGGPNATRGFEGDALVNPWDYILMLEGAVMLAAAAVRRLGRHAAGRAAFPFTFDGSAGAFPTAVAGDQGRFRAEMWLPVWSRPASYVELTRLFAEGRAEWQGRQARTAVDVARAALTLGVDRGIHSFERIGLLMRNGLAYISLPLGRFRVRHQAEAELLADLDSWLVELHRACGDRAPARCRAALSRIEDAILTYCAEPGPERLQAIIMAVGAAEREIALSRSFRQGGGLPPFPGFGPEWIRALEGDRSDEYRIAAAVASLPALRPFFEPVAWDGNNQVWAWQESSSVVWSPHDPLRSLVEILRRLLRRAETGGTSDAYVAGILKQRRVRGERGTEARVIAPSMGGNNEATGDEQVGGPELLAHLLAGDLVAPAQAVLRFVNGELDMERITALLQGLVLIRWHRRRSFTRARPGELASEADDGATAGIDSHSAGDGGNDPRGAGDGDGIESHRQVADDVGTDWPRGGLAVALLPRLYARMKLLFWSQPLPTPAGDRWARPEATALRLLEVGRCVEAEGLAVARLRATGVAAIRPEPPEPIGPVGRSETDDLHRPQAANGAGVRGQADGQVFGLRLAAALLIPLVPAWQLTPMAAGYGAGEPGAEEDADRRREKQRSTWIRDRLVERAGEQVEKDGERNGDEAAAQPASAAANPAG